MSPALLLRNPNRSSYFLLFEILLDHSRVSGGPLSFNRVARSSADIFCSSECTCNMTSLSCFNSWGVFFSTRMAAAISLLSSFEIAMVQV